MKTLKFTFNEFLICQRLLKNYSLKLKKEIENLEKKIDSIDYSELKEISEFSKELLISLTEEYNELHLLLKSISNQIELSLK